MISHKQLLNAGLALIATAMLSGRASADEATYEIQKSVAPATVGAPATVSLTVVGKNGWHVNGEAPISAAVKADPGVALPKAKLTRADLAQSSKESARFDIPYSSSEAGKKAITAQTRFVMCQEQACKPASETVAFEVNVQAAPAPGAAPVAKGKTTPAKASAAKATAVKPAANSAPKTTTP
jgi:hypothetical protein